MSKSCDYCEKQIAFKNAPWIITLGAMVDIRQEGQEDWPLIRFEPYSAENPYREFCFGDCLCEFIKSKKGKIKFLNQVVIKCNFMPREG